MSKSNDSQNSDNELNVESSEIQNIFSRAMQTDYEYDSEYNEKLFNKVSETVSTQKVFADINSEIYPSYLGNSQSSEKNPAGHRNLKRQYSDDFAQQEYSEVDYVSDLDDLMSLIERSNLENDKKHNILDPISNNNSDINENSDFENSYNKSYFIGSNTRSKIKPESSLNHTDENRFDDHSDFEASAGYVSNDSAFAIQNSDNESYTKYISNRKVDENELSDSSKIIPSIDSKKNSNNLNNLHINKNILNQKSLLEQLYGDSDNQSTSDSSIDGIQENFKKLNGSNFDSSKGIGKKMAKRKKNQKENEIGKDQGLLSNDNSDNDADSSKELSNVFEEDVHNDSDDNSHEIEENAWSSIQEILNFQPGFVESIKNTKSRQKKKLTRKKLGPEIMTLLGEANIEYVNRDFDKAVTYLQEVIRIDPGVFQAWHTLALIQEELGNHDRALKLYLMSAHLAPANSDLWKGLASLWMGQLDTLSTELKSRVGTSYDKIIKGIEVKLDHSTTDLVKKVDSIRDQTIYALGKACIADPNDLNLFLKRLSIFEELQNYPMMGVCYIGIMRIQPLNIMLIRKILPLFIHNLNNTNHPSKWLSYILKTYWKICRSDKLKQISDKKFGYSDLNILIELRMLREEYEIAILELKRGARLIQGRAAEKKWEVLELDDINDLEFEGEENQLPIELVVKLGQCRIITGSIDGGKKQIDKLYEYPVDEYIDLYQDVVSTFRDAKLFYDAIFVSESILENTQNNKPVVWAQLALFYKELGNINKAIKYATLVIQEDIDEVPMRVFLCEMYEKKGDIDSALAMFTEVETIRSKIIAEEIKIPTPGLYLTDTTNPDNSWKVEKRKYVPMPFFRNTRPANKNYYQAEKEGLVDYTNDKSSFGASASANAESVEFNADQSFLANDQDSFLNVRTYKFSSLAIARIKAAEVVFRRQASSIRDAKMAFKKLDLLGTKKIDDKSFQIEYCRSARILFNDWRRTTAFYSQNKKQFTGYQYRFDGLGEEVVMSTDNAYKDIQNIEEGFEKRIKLLKGRLNHRLQKDNITDKNDTSTNDNNKIPTSFRGVHFDEWKDMFEMYAYVLCKMGNVEESVAMLETVSESNVFNNSGYTRAWFKLLTLKIALHSKNYDAAYNVARWFCGSKPSHGRQLKFFLTVIQSNPNISKSFIKKSKSNPYLSFFDNNAKKKKSPTVYNSSDPDINESVIDGTDFESLDSEKDYNLNSIGLNSIYPYKPNMMDLKAMIIASANISATNGTTRIAIALSIDPNDSSVLLSISHMYYHSIMNKMYANRSEKLTKCLYFLFQYAKLREKELVLNQPKNDLQNINTEDDLINNSSEKINSSERISSLNENESKNTSIFVYHNNPDENSQQLDLEFFMAATFSTYLYHTMKEYLK
ncbi:hypothetical protein BB561_001297 [Smittium simulii]|uniref:Uncharacterized protein n=1 Tax=Smittium simulii TaxID=133385 RepID=A0A2T9YV77_9FUNG|nr:hypothetical protein BB561_001297 [Smittium simulii]